MTLTTYSGLAAATEKLLHSSTERVASTPLISLQDGASLFVFLFVFIFDRGNIWDATGIIPMTINSDSNLFLFLFRSYSHSNPYKDGKQYKFYSVFLVVCGMARSCEIRGTPIKSDTSIHASDSHFPAIDTNVTPTVLSPWYCIACTNSVVWANVHNSSQSLVSP